ERLSRRGVCVVRIPMADSDTWREYGTNWVELDPPRHLFLHTRRSLEHVVNGAGMTIKRSVYDADGFVHWASVLYQRNTQLTDPSTFSLRNPAEYFTQDELNSYELRAKEANEKRIASRATFVLTPIRKW